MSRRRSRIHAMAFALSLSASERVQFPQAPFQCASYISLLLAHTAQDLPIVSPGIENPPSISPRREILISRETVLTWPPSRCCAPWPWLSPSRMRSRECCCRLYRVPSRCPGPRDLRPGPAACVAFWSISIDLRMFSTISSNKYPTHQSLIFVKAQPRA